MRLAVGMVADDLTGALDAAAPFALRGLRTLVVPSLEHLPAALPAGVEVLCVNTASREIPAAEAARRAGAAAAWLMRLAPRVVFKKVDSRLKGHLPAEIAAVLAATGRSRALVAPAIPDLGRRVEDGCLVGLGVPEPVSVAAACAGLPAETPDTRSDADLDVLAARLLAEGDALVAVGARGLAAALARTWPARPAPVPPLPLARPALIAIGSRDPITRGQVAHYRTQARPGELCHLPAPNGAVPAGSAAPVTLVTAEPGPAEEPPAAVAARFAEGLSGHVRSHPPASLLISGGETAFALLTRLGVDVIEVGGEALPGVPFAHASIAGRTVLLLTKSGGFGGPETISILAGVPADVD